MSSEVQKSNHYNYDTQGRPIIPNQEELNTLPKDGGIFSEAKKLEKKIVKKENIEKK